MVEGVNESDTSAPPSFPPPNPKLNGCDDDGLEAVPIVEALATDKGDPSTRKSFPPPWLPKLNGSDDDGLEAGVVAISGAEFGDWVVMLVILGAHAPPLPFPSPPPP